MITKFYRIEESRNGKVINQFSGSRHFTTTASLEKAQDELLNIYNTVAGDVFAESWQEAASFGPDETSAEPTYINGDVMGFIVERGLRSFDIVEHHTYDVYYCDDVNDPVNLDTCLSLENAENYIRQEMRDVTCVDYDHVCTDDVFSSASVACYRVYKDMDGEPEMVYESDYFYTDDTPKDDAIMRTMTEEQAKEICKEAANRTDKELSGADIDYEILSVAPIEGEDAYLVTFEGGCASSSAVIYGDGTVFFIDDWQGSYPTDKTQFANYDWVDEHFRPVPIFEGMPRTLLS